VEVMFCEETLDVFCMPVTPGCSEGALGTWRSQGGPRTLSRDKPAFEAGTRSCVNQRGRGVCMSVLELRRASGKAHEGKPRSEPDWGNPTVRECVQRRLACSAGDSPAGAETRSPVAWIAERREIDDLKPIDRPSLREGASHRAVTKVNADVASKCGDLKAEPASGGRRQHGQPKSGRRGCSTSAG
jgi:hypothetical protein